MIVSDEDEFATRDRLLSSRDIANELLHLFEKQSNHRAVSDEIFIVEKVSIRRYNSLSMFSSSRVYYRVWCFVFEID